MRNKPLHNFLRRPGFDRQKVVGDSLAWSRYGLAMEMSIAFIQRLKPDLNLNPQGFWILRFDPRNRTSGPALAPLIGSSVNLKLIEQQESVRRSGVKAPRALAPAL